MREWTFSASPGTPVYATGDGVVVKAGWETGYGNTDRSGSWLSGIVTWYAHLSKLTRYARGKRWYSG